MYTYIHIYIYTYLHICIYAYIHIYVYTYIRIYIFTFIHIYIYTYIHIYIYTYIYTNLYSYLNTYIHTYIYIHMHICIHAFVYIHTQYIYIYIQCTSMFLGGKSCEFLEEHLLAIPNMKIIIPELCRRRRSVSLQKACPTAAALLRPEIFDQVCAICLVLTWTCQRNPYTVTDRSVATKINDEHIYI